MARTFQREIQSDARAIDHVLPDLVNFLEANRLEASVMYIVQLLVEELLLNVMKHAYRGEPGRAIALRVDVEPGEATIEVEDSGDPFDPRSAPEPEFDRILHGERIGGLGVHLVRSLAASLDYARVDNRNRVRVHILPLPPAAS